MKILCIGDSFVTCDTFRAGLVPLLANHMVRVCLLDEEASFEPGSPSERSLRESAGTPRGVIGHLENDEVLLVHAAPVTDAVIDTSPRLKLIGVARGGPVNVDIEAA